MKKKGDLDFIGDHIATNLINTRRMHEGVLIDTLQTDQDVIEWMRKMSIGLPLLQSPLKPGTLVRTARNLRDLALRALEQRKAGKHVSLGELNSFLTDTVSRFQLKERDHRLELQRMYLSRSARQYLAPLAEQIADLLANGDFNLIRHCEGENCVLWFYDRTKGHRRRWCTGEGCGTRARVSAFRARRASTSE